MRRTTVTYLVCAMLAGLSFSCNEHPLRPLDDSLLVTVSDISERIGSNAVDVLWIVDNSGSMSEEQAELGARFDQFIEALADLEADFNMAVVTTDIDDGGRFQTQPGRVQSPGNCNSRLPELAYCDDLRLDRPFLEARNYQDIAEDGTVTLRTADLARDFRCIASVGDCGAVIERGLDSMDLALSPELLNSSNAGFLRDDAFLLVIALSDEDDCSNIPGTRAGGDDVCYSQEGQSILRPVQEFYDRLVELKTTDPNTPGDSRVLIAGIIGNDAGPRLTQREILGGGLPIACSDDVLGQANDGKRYRELVELAGARGTEEIICQGDFSSALASIGQILRQNLGVNCLRQEPRTCETDADCVDGVACIQPGDPLVGNFYCADFELVVDVREPASSSFRNIKGPGAAGEPVPYADAEFVVDYDANACLHGIAFGFAPGARPPVNSSFRASYPRATDVIRAGEDELESGE